MSDIKIPKVSDDDGNRPITEDDYVDTDEVVVKDPRDTFWNNTKGVLKKVVTSPILEGVIMLTPKPVRLGFRWLKFKLNTNNMIKDKKWYQSKTIWSALIMAITAALQGSGVEVISNPELMQTVYEVIYLLAGAFGLVGLRAAVGDMVDKGNKAEKNK